MRPILLELGDLRIHSFGVLVALGFLLGLRAAASNARRVGLNGDIIYDLAPWLIASGLIGARLMYVVSYWNESFAGQPWREVFAVWKGGLVFYGGLILAILIGLWRIRSLGLPLWTTADCLAPGIALGHVFGRLGCLMNGCCFGRPTTLPWAIHFPNGHASGGLGVHPSQVYESLLNLAFFTVLMWGFRHRLFSGQIFALYLIGYSMLRAFTEWFRGDYARVSQPLSGSFTPGQSTGLVLLVAGVALYLTLKPRTGVGTRGTGNPN